MDLSCRRISGCWRRGFFGEDDAKRFEKGEVAVGEGTFGGVSRGELQRLEFERGGIVYLVEADGGFEHEEDVEALLADVFDDSGDVLGLGDGLVDGFAELLDEIFYFLIQCHPGKQLETG